MLKRLLFIIAFFSLFCGNRTFGLAQSHGPDQITSSSSLSTEYTVSGYVRWQGGSPMPNVGVLLLVQYPNSPNPVQKTAFTNSDGFFTISFAPSIVFDLLLLSYNNYDVIQFNRPAGQWEYWILVNN